MNGWPYPRPRAALAATLDALSMPLPFCGCQVWIGGTMRNGYGTVQVGNSRAASRLRPAHVVAYEIAVGPVPEGLELDHLCRVRSCINPAHLEPVTRTENVRRGAGPAVQRARFEQRTHCREGHPLSGDNLMRLPNGERRCRICRRAKWHAWNTKRNHRNV